MSEHLGVTLFDNTPGVEVTGRVQGHGTEKAFLQLTWKYPGLGVGGVYQCVVHGFNPQGHLNYFSSTVEVSESEVSHRCGQLCPSVEADQ